METKRKGLRYRMGMLCIVLAVISPLLALLVPLFGLSQAQATTLVGALLVGGPEVFLVLGAALAGKDAVNTIKAKAKALLGLGGPPRPVGRTRYRVGLFLMVGSALANWVLAYLGQLGTMGLDAGTILTATLVLDFVTITSFFVVGGQFWEKLKQLFTWEPE